MNVHWNMSLSTPAADTWKSCFGAPYLQPAVSQMKMVNECKWSFNSRHRRKRSDLMLHLLHVSCLASLWCIWYHLMLTVTYCPPNSWCCQALLRAEPRFAMSANLKHAEGMGWLKHGMSWYHFATNNCCLDACTLIFVYLLESNFELTAKQYSTSWE